MKQLFNCYYHYTIVPAVLFTVLFGLICGFAPLFMVAAPALTQGNIATVFFLVLALMTIEDIISFRKTGRLKIG